MRVAPMLVLAALMSMIVAICGADDNIALGRPYTLFPAPNYALCSADRDRKLLTDGSYTQGHFWTQPSTVGWTSAGPVIITIDLGSVQPIRGACLNTAAGIAGVEWPRSILLTVSDDGHAFHEAGDLVALSAVSGSPAPQGYAIHRYRTSSLKTHGRYLAFVVDPVGSYFFADEVEVIRGEGSWLTLPAAGPAITNLLEHFKAGVVRRSMDSRIRADLAAVRKEAADGSLPTDFRRSIEADLASIETSLAIPEAASGSSFRAVLPLNDAHARVFQTQARLWRRLGVAPLTAGNCGLWDPQSPTQMPPVKSGAVVRIVMMRNEYRAGAFNLSNAGERPLTVRLRISGLPGGDNPSFITVHEVAWTDTKSGTPVAAALPEARRDGAYYRVDIPSGMTRQVWLTVHSKDIPAGSHRGQISVTGSGAALSVPINLEVSRVVFPPAPTLHLGGWDYTDVETKYEINPRNRQAVIAHLREHFVDSPWATSAVLSSGRWDEHGAMRTPPDTTAFDTWLKRWPGARQYCVFASVGDSFDGAEMGTPEFDAKVRAWLGFWAGAAVKRGLKPRQLAILLVDEPQEPKQDATILAWARAARAANTGIKIWEDTNHAKPAVADQQMMRACDVLCPNRVSFLSADASYREYYANRRASGTELAFYSCSGPVRLLDPYTYHRLQAWSCWLYGAKSSYFWAFGDSGGGSSWNEYAAPGAAFVPFFLDRDTVTPGKHMEAIREGVEDYEYLVMLAAAVAKAQAAGRHDRVIESASRLLAEAPARVCDASGAGAMMWSDAKDRSVADQVRLDILHALESLQRY